MPSISYEEWNSTFGRSHVKVSDISLDISGSCFVFDIIDLQDFHYCFLMGAKHSNPPRNTPLSASAFFAAMRCGFPGRCMPSDHNHIPSFRQ